MAIKALDLTKTKVVSSKYDTEKDETKKTKFKVGVLSFRDVGRIRDLVTSITVNAAQEEDGTDEVLTNIERSKMQFEACRRGIRGWENFMGPDDKPVKFKTQTREVDGASREVVPDDLLNMIPLQVIVELSDIVMSDNDITEEDVKN
ncbi:MAG: hypothetical protein JKY92_08190 [Magnetovibrio sp.]|nr:hypothetical protein [Magnetovibrio sp.]